MKNVVVELDKDSGRDRATQYFMDIAGLYKRDGLNPKYHLESLKTLDDIYNDIIIKAVFSRYDGSSLSKGRLTLDNVSFNCFLLNNLASGELLGLYVYILTIGRSLWDCERVLYQVYYDMWETAFVDLGRDLLKEYIVKLESGFNSSFCVSDSFGPGFYGLPVSVGAHLPGAGGGARAA